MKKITSILLFAAVAVIANCKEKGKIADGKATGNTALSQVKVGALIPSDQAAKMGAYMSKQSGKAGRFRAEDVAKADGKLLSYLLGCNLAELNIALQAKNQELYKSSIIGLNEISNRANAVGNFPWADAVLKVLAALKDQQIDQAYAAELIQKVAVEAAKASEHPEVQQHLAFGYATFYSAISFAVGGGDQDMPSVIDAFLAMNPNTTPASKQHYDDAKASIAEGKKDEAAKSLLLAASTF